MIGDVVGDPGLDALERRLPSLIKENSANFVMINGENAAGGFGLTAAILEKIFNIGVDVVSSGNHIWEKREFWSVLNTEKRVLRPMNYPTGCPGNGWIKLEKSPGPVSWIAVNLQGREFMTPIDCPFKNIDDFVAGQGDSVSETHLILTSDGLLPEYLQEKSVILVDFHAESSREKEALAYYLDGRVTVITGTHTHVQTADERILPKGTAYITDLGMTGALDGIIGMDTKICLDRARNQVLYRMEVAAPDMESKTTVQGIIVEINAETCKAVSIKRFSV
jgi:calcineurin-like phosphoesterase